MRVGLNIAKLLHAYAHISRPKNNPEEKRGHLSCKVSEKTTCDITIYKVNLPYWPP